jgi:hypothetical protein
VAECAGFVVEESGLVSGRLANFPEFLIVPDGAPQTGKEMVVLVAHKPREGGC